MKKTKKTALTALILTSAVSMTSCDWFSGGYQAVYGPPPDMDSSSSSTDYDPYYDNMQAEYEAPVDMSSEPPTTEYDPYYDDIQSEYEAPVEEMTEQATTETAIDEYIPQDEEPAVVYGPPPDMD